MLPVWMPDPSTPGMGSPTWRHSGIMPSPQAGHSTSSRRAEHPSQGLTTTVVPGSKPAVPAPVIRATIS